MRTFRKISREDLGQEELWAWDAIAGTRGGVWGPYSVLMSVPELCGRVAAVGEYLRFKGGLPGNWRELAILCAARESESRFEWAVHEPEAVRAGTNRAAIDVVRAKGDAARLPPEERLIVEVVRSLFRERTVSQELFAEAFALLGEDPLKEVMVVAGFYGLLSFVLNGFAVPVPEGSAETF